MSKPLLFSKGIPSNFYQAAIVLPNPIRTHEQATFPSNEHYFQACKVALCNKGNSDMYQEIVEADTAYEAKQLGRLVPLTDEQLKQWDDCDAMVSMLQANLAKFSQHKDCLRWLRRTEDRPLVEHRKDPVWGDNLDGKGMNLQGKILEVVRARFC